ncbi:MAG: AraC family transcriptional regulator [Lachnospiraceae bacterium]|jgi:AraC-like DNA-binding protein/mannose-6-phosphate isomerase-like protein (cupin superfamily)|nr:AraC family transcriptional regulator [Lachnospiraceae bacterium]
MYIDEFTQRQIMNERFYEYHHYRNEGPITIDFHQHAFYEIYIFISGDVNYTIEGRTYKLRPGDILLTNNSDIHRPEIMPSQSPYERIVIWLNNSFFNGLLDIGEDLTTCFQDASNRNYRLFRPNEAQLLKIQNICHTIEQERSHNKLGSRIMAYSSIMEILVLISRVYYEISDSARHGVTENKQINQIVSYINNHFSEDLSLECLADQFYLSKYYLSHRFKQFTGLSLYQFIMKKRLTIARNMLMGGKNVTEACTECGFNDYSNFLKAFKREFGEKPSEFIKR